MNSECRVNLIHKHTGILYELIQQAKTVIRDAGAALHICWAESSRVEAPVLRLTARLLGAMPFVMTGKAKA